MSDDNKVYLYRKVFINGILTAISGIHIGSSKDAVQIGGVSNPVIRRKDNGQPYLSGSSIKGKMRSLLEQKRGIDRDEKKQFQHDGGDVCNLFGALDSDDKKGADGEPIKGHPSRLIVRDAYMRNSTIKMLEESPFVESPYTEVKFENSINRETGTAENPRQTERVPAGSKFKIEFVLNIYAKNRDEANKHQAEYIKTLKEGIDLLEDDYLGGNGSRGYGQVLFNLKLDEELEKNSFDSKKHLGNTIKDYQSKKEG